MKFLKLVIIVASLHSVYSNALEVNEDLAPNDSMAEQSTSASASENGDKTLVLINYLLNKEVQIDNPETLTAEEGAQFVPQIDEILDIYVKYIHEGNKPIEAIVMAHISPESLSILRKYSPDETRKLEEELKRQDQ